MWQIIFSFLAALMVAACVLTVGRMKVSRRAAKASAEALRHSCTTVETEVVPLVSELERIHRENNLAPRISAAFRLHHHLGGGA